MVGGFGPLARTGCPTAGWVVAGVCATLALTHWQGMVADRSADGDGRQASTAQLPASDTAGPWASLRSKVLTRVRDRQSRRTDSTSEPANLAPVVDCGRVDLQVNRTGQPWCDGHSVPPIWLTYFVDLINDPEAAARYETLAKNVRNTVALHPGLAARFLLDDDCLTMLSEVDTLLNVSLAATFRAERDGSFRGDICRAAALYLYGGFYFDLDLHLILDVRTVLPASTTFVTAKTEKNGYFFNAIIGVTPHHIVMRQYLTGLQRYFGGNKTMYGIAQPGVGWKHGKTARFPGDMVGGDLPLPSSFSNPSPVSCTATAT